MSDPIKKYCPFHTDRRRALAEGDYCAECLVEELHRNGFRECDIAACNCGGWHNPTIAKLTEENKALRAELEKLKKQADNNRPKQYIDYGQGDDGQGGQG